MSAGWRVQAGVRNQKSFDRLAADNVRIHNFFDILHGHSPIPNGIWIDHNIRAVLTLIEAPRLVGPYSSLQAAFR